MNFDILGEVTGAETFSAGSGIREIARLRRLYGKGRWRKRKGIAKVRLENGHALMAEIHWYEATGIGKPGIQNQAVLVRYSHGTIHQALRHLRQQ